MKKEAIVIAVTSGKGGVGKSVVAVNLAEVLASNGYRVALLDNDLGQGACALLLNEAPERGLSDVAAQVVELEATFHETLGGITLVQAAAEPSDAINRQPELFAALDDALSSLKSTHDYILIDTPAGIDAPVQWALDRANLAILVLVGEPTAIADAYRLVKFVWETDPAYPFTVVVNHAETEEEATSVAERFNAVTGRFTGSTTTYLGWVPFSSDIRSSVQQQCPVVRQPSKAAEHLSELAAALITGTQEVIP